ncbi:SigE family RNA polymerase sigma factor [Actinoplanes aureus]|uniref:SigE family RNA polymerase sigma factor n=1 Tax=Actinoplanes aureus TaxID=2792083 RepID=A0A931FXR2_9ACTN|nr:SigE family RNA polymerase sigma factor [Actinoplanes aureus]MBG0562977.1 SigE family RNA polymerase sigma factor [Actinoplanes aureus]
MRDPSGFDEFYRDTSARMVRYGYALTGELAEAQDLVQEAYTRAWRQWRTVSAHPAPEAWIRLVIARLASDRRRRIRGWWTALSRSGPPEPARPPADDTVLVTAALRRLPEHLRQALALHYLFDLPVAAIAEETGVPVGTVTSWLTRGRRELASLLSAPDAVAAPRGPRSAAYGHKPTTPNHHPARLEGATDVE